MRSLKINHCECQDIRILNFDDDQFNVWFNYCGEYTRMASCANCNKQYNLTLDDIERYENRSVTCCHCKNHIHVKETCSMLTPFNGEFGQKLISVNTEKIQNTTKVDFRSYLCIACINFCGYHEIPKKIYCDRCHSAHDRIVGSDDQGDGLCGEVMRNCSYSAPWNGFALDEQLVGYVINCEYGSKYDAMDDSSQFIKFSAPKLPPEFTIGMNICDECITQLIKDGICI